MAPRGRSMKKPGLQRIDAAFDALFPLGFSRHVIKKTIKELLETYGGDEGWVFIEEASYRLLIETILGQQEEDQNHNSIKGKGEDVDNSRALEVKEQIVDAGSTSVAAAIECGGLHSGAGDLALTSRAVDDEHEDAIHVPAGYANSNLLSVTAGDSHEHNVSAATGSVSPCSLRQSNEVPTPRRPPCYGWISETESDSESEEEP